MSNWRSGNDPTCDDSLQNSGDLNHKATKDTKRSQTEYLFFSPYLSDLCGFVVSSPNPQTMSQRV